LLTLSSKVWFNNKTSPYRSI